MLYLVKLDITHTHMCVCVCVCVCVPVRWYLSLSLPRTFGRYSKIYVDHVGCTYVCYYCTRFHSFLCPSKVHQAWKTDCPWRNIFLTLPFKPRGSKCQRSHSATHLILKVWTAWHVKRTGKSYLCNHMYELSRLLSISFMTLSEVINSTKTFPPW